MHAFLQSQETLAEFARAFEAGELPRDVWTHAAHVAVGTVFCRRDGAHVLAPMRAALRQHAAALGAPPTAYHETLTVLWLAIIGMELHGRSFTNDLEAARHNVSIYGAGRKLHDEYYSFDLLLSDDARQRGVEPDRRPVEVRFLLTAS